MNNRKGDKKRTRKRPDLHERYRKALKRPDLTAEQIEAMRRNLSLLAQTICEHVWGQRFY